MSKAVDVLGWIRSLWGCIHVPHFFWGNPLESFKQLPRAIVVTDCRSLYDLVSRLAMPACEEYGTTLEVLLIKQRTEENVLQMDPHVPNARGCSYQKHGTHADAQSTQAGEIRSLRRRSNSSQEFATQTSNLLAGDPGLRIHQQATYSIK